MTTHDPRALHVHTRGSGPVLTFLHGFTQTSRSWDAIVGEFDGTNTCQCVDLPGHGSSPDGRRHLREIADDVVASTLPGTIIGYSFGARVALHMAVFHPEHVHRLVLVSGTAGIFDEHERAQRRAADDELAMRIEEIGVNDFIDEWLALPLFAGLTPATDLRADRCSNSAIGLADSLRYAGAGTQQPLWNQLGDIACDVLIVAGGLDKKFVDIGERMREAIPHSQLEVVPGAGHTVHLERPHEFVRILRTWIATHA